ncbi:hypothetical protein [Flagellimonas sp. CMM7]|uniref:hypothetical protein n=1 Tax=Flagellimonas sp. CMM7 TaxID=2654676 RepID=UPI0013D62334|nr:hypothetical protein [Flagellimonas sp. CMM7]UII80002.1 hypothetical protein LV704_00425 [Flagellimonas sp. CMM7]
MPTTTTVTSNYEGKEAGAIIGASFKEADTISKGLVTVAQNVNHKLNLRRIRYTDGTTAYSCGHTPAGAIVLDERVLQPVKLKNDFDVCKEDFRATWSSDLIGDSAANPNMASDIQDAILAEVLAETAQRTDGLIWNGDDTNTDEWDGFLTQFAADAAVVKVGNGITSVAAATTKANVLSHFDIATAAIPVALRRKELKFIISPDVADAYSKTLVESGITNGLGGNANTQFVYGRYTVDVVNGLPDNTIVIYEAKNLVFGTGLLGDHNQVAIVDEDEIGLLTGQVRGKMVYNAGVNYYNSEDVVWFLTTA